jgi:uncharacterized protein YqeY
MTIKEELGSELREAMKSGDIRRRDVIRQVETEISLARSAEGFSGDVDDDLYRRVMASYVKKMDKARSEYEGYGERGMAMAEKLAFEVSYLGRWLPKRLDEQSTRALVAAAVEELRAVGDPKAAGRVVGHLMRSRKDQLDGNLVNRLVREMLGSE